MATSVAAFLDRRIDTGTLPIAVGDVIVIALFITAGTIRHQGVPFVSSHPGYLANTIAPFLLGWIVAAPLIGAYSAGAAESAKSAVPLAIRSWIAADVIGVLVRWTPLFHGGGPLIDLVVFALVTSVVGVLCLGLWRWLYFKLR